MENYSIYKEDDNLGLVFLSKFSIIGSLCSPLISPIPENKYTAPTHNVSQASKSNYTILLPEYSKTTTSDIQESFVDENSDEYKCFLVKLVDDAIAEGGRKYYNSVEDLFNDL